MAATPARDALRFALDGRELGLGEALLGREASLGARLALLGRDEVAAEGERLALLGRDVRAGAALLGRDAGFDMLAK